MRRPSNSETATSKGLRLQGSHPATVRWMKLHNTFFKALVSPDLEPLAGVVLNGPCGKSGLHMKSKAMLRGQSQLQRRRLAGFSLFEATMAMAVVGICSLALFSGFTGGFFNMQMARENLRATQIMLEKTETLRLYSWDQINSNGFVLPNFTQKYDPNAPAGSQGLTYSGTVDISPAPLATSYSNNVKLVTVTLNWKTGGINRTRQFTTYIAQNGLQNYIY